MMKLYEKYFCWDVEDITLDNISYVDTYETDREVLNNQAKIKELEEHSYVGKCRVIKVTVSAENFAEAHNNSMIVVSTYLRNLPKPIKKETIKEKESLIDTILGGIKNVSHKRRT